jgi:hypothetical protein
VYQLQDEIRVDIAYFEAAEGDGKGGYDNR